ncbi:MAG: YgiQ family radical SAM protein [Planctomycetaceae bacterium]|jgi:uncharacterized radical SAM protein YgiQ|nr:YgiQ family radical SAM protein [Planctomycetaceae bacterium]
MSQSQLLPVSRDEMLSRGWEELDVVFVTGDAYVDHPGFAVAILSRFLESSGFRVGIISQPDWHSADAWKIFGQPKLAFCISAGNMDSMINHYTANRKIRGADAYSPNGQIGLRPDRATLAYSQRAREAFPDCPVIIGGVEASLRRFAHYDYWSDKIKRSIALDSKADLLIYGMGEMPLLEIITRLRDGEPVQTIRNVRGSVYRLKQSEDLPPESKNVVHLPSMEEIEEDKLLFARMTRLIYDNLNPFLNITLVQEHAKEAVVANPPAMPLSQDEIDNIYNLPFTRKPHPIYDKKNQKIPAWEVIKNSIQIHRGCFGGCSFCSIAAHQGKFIQSRSKKSILNEIKSLTKAPDFNGIISDLGGPTANMYELYCRNTEAKQNCQRISCLFPDQCGNLKTDHGELIELMRETREIPNVRQVLIASGVRTDLAQLDKRYISELAAFHVGGHLKTAPEHVHQKVLNLMHKPPFDNYLNFCNEFSEHSQNAGKEQYLVPYLIAGFPGTTLQIAIDAAVCLKQHNIKSEQIQEFVPCPGELATCIYYTGINPLDGEPVYVPKKLRERRLQKALLMYHKPENYHDIKTALHEAKREDLIGNGASCLITAFPPKAESIKRTSQVKRLKKQNEKEKIEKEKRRELYELAAEEIKQKKFTQKFPDKKYFKPQQIDPNKIRSRYDETRQLDSDKTRPRRDENRRFDSDKTRPRRDENRRFDSDKTRPRRDENRRFDSDKTRPRRDENRRFDSDRTRPRRDENRRFDSDKTRPIRDESRRFDSDRTRPRRDENRRFDSDKTRPKRDENRRFDSDKTRPIRDENRRFDSDKTRPRRDENRRFDSDKTRPKRDENRQFDQDKPRRNFSDGRRFDGKPKRREFGDNSDLRNEKNYRQKSDYRKTADEKSQDGNSDNGTKRNDKNFGGGDGKRRETGNSERKFSSGAKRNNFQSKNHKPKKF